LFIGRNVGGGRVSEGTKKFHYVDGVYKASQRAAKHYADMCGADYLCLQIPWAELPHHAYSYHKLYMYEKFVDNNYQEVLYVDADMFILKECPNLFGQDSEFDFAAVADFPATTTNYRNLNEQRRKTCGIRKNRNHTYFVASLMLLKWPFYEATKDH
jgi:lipopolysaccharide biosynthesis glycosyltransferase